MIRGSWVWRNGELVEKGGAKDVHQPVARSSLPSPMLIGDTMPAAEHIDGRFYDSKSAYRAVTKANGLTEVGNDTARFRRPAKPDNDKGIDQAIERALARAS